MNHQANQAHSGPVSGQAATLIPGTFDHITPGHRRRVLDRAWLLIDLERGRTQAELRTYYTQSGSTAYACFWLRGPHRCGSGRATGGGYHKASAAAAGAIEGAGIMLAKDIDGRGDNAIREALDAVAIMLGIDRYLVEEVAA